MTKMTTCDLHNETIIRLKKRIEELERECRQQSAGVLVLASQRANYLERAEKAESSLRECVAHAEALCERLASDHPIDQTVGAALPEEIYAFREWRASHE